MNAPAMPPILVVEQEPSLEGLGLLGQRLEESGLPYRRLQMWREPLDGHRARDFAALIPLGGNSHAWQEEDLPFLRQERELLGEALEEGVPVLGICLGAQLLARSLGADVRAAAGPEIGWLEVTPTAAGADDPLFGHWPGPVGVYHWHHDSFELPAGATLLASSELCENQAFRIGDAWGIQFHPEVEPDWFEILMERHPGAAAANGVDEEALRAAVWGGADSSRPLRARLFDAFLDVVRNRWRS